ncbi:hypothetical protein RUE5091_00646 [Ruegeria denitrificans]|uniref:Lipoprotein n=1 Tax=Ruegeria denitrificans TaxID=1715692 RepID=A0A0P1I3I7_9RHOB|nr:hypothetical protein [Ruegeria denitrificans]CUJ88090.1 hypothetical protein RUE5091_00646 [Ruegeria denitrificans]
MKSVLRLLFPIMALSACEGPLALYYREGESVSRLQTETTQCQVQAVNEVPVANQTRQSPPTYWPGRTYCDGRGRCYRSPGWWQPGRVYTVDVNQGLRNQVEAQCMAKKGFRPISLPPCKQNVKSQVPAVPTTTLPPVGTQSCYVKFDNGSFQIITPGQPG